MNDACRGRAWSLSPERRSIRAMRKTTLDARELATEWYADCPRCEKRVTCRDFVCPNCERGGFRYFRESHSAVESSKDPHYQQAINSWLECGLECPVDGTKLRSFPCPHDCGGVILLGCIYVHITPLLQDESLFNKFMGCVCLLLPLGITVKFWSKQFILSKNFMNYMGWRFPADPLWNFILNFLRLSIGIAIIYIASFTICFLLCLKFIPGFFQRKWQRYDP